MTNQINKIFGKSLFLLLIIQNIYGANQTVGSDNSTSAPQAHWVFDGFNNKVANYAVVDNGFSYADINTTCSFASLFPVKGPINLRGGSIFLNRDLEFSEGGRFANAGLIYGNDHNIIVSEEDDYLASAKLFLNFIDDHNIGSIITSLAWSADSNYIVLEKYLGHFWDGDRMELHVYQFNGSNLTYKNKYGSSIKGLLKSVEWHPKHYYIATGDPDVWEVRIFKYNSGSNTISNPDNLKDTQKTYAVSWHKSGDYLATGQIESTRIAIFGFNQTDGTFTNKNNPIVNTPHSKVSTTAYIGDDAMSWSPANDYLVVGYANTGDSKHELIIFKFDEGAQTLTHTVGLNLSDSVTHVDWSPTGSFIAVGLSSSNERVRIYEHKVWNGTIEEKTNLRVGENVTVRSVSWSYDGNYLAVARESGAGSEFKVYKFNKDTHTLFLVDEFGSSLNLYATEWAPTTYYLAEGGAKQYLNVYGLVGGCDEYIFYDTDLYLNNDFKILYPTIFDGNCSIYGDGKKLTLDETGEINVNPSSTLKIINAEIDGLKNHNLKCYQNNGNIILQNCKLILSQDFEIDTGSILFQRDVTISGSSKFGYSSVMNSTIDSNSTLYFEPGTTFYYDPQNNNRDLIYMNDKTSNLFLNDCTLHSTTTGCRLTRGTLLVDNNVTINADGSAISEAICLGNNSLENNLNIEVLASAQLNVFGRLEYENTN